MPLSAPDILIAAVAIAVLALFVAAVGIVSQRRQMGRLLGALRDDDMKDGLARLLERTQPLDERLRAVEKIQGRLVASEPGRLGGPGLVHFQAYGSDGPPLSFSLALLDGSRQGVVLTSLYGRDQIRLYAKPIHGGGSPAELSTEEARALELAMAGGGHQVLQGELAAMASGSASLSRGRRGRVRQ